MTPRRKETTLPMDEAPIRFYKFVAITFLVITIILLGLIIFMSTKRATIIITTKESPVDVNLEMTLGDDADVAAIVTSTMITISGTFEPTGDSQVEETAIGEIEIINDSNTVQPLVATTRFLSSDGVLFRLEEGVTVPAQGRVTAAVYADQEGASGNIDPTSFTIPGLNSTRQQEVYGESLSPMTGGLRTIGILSASDIARAEEQLKEQAIEGVTAALQLGDTDTDVLISVVDVTSQTETPVGEEVSSFNLTAEVVVVAVKYEKDLVGEYADNLLKQREIDDTEIISPTGAEPVVTFGSYDANDNEVLITVFHSGMAMLNAESKQLDKLMFLGKSRDEVRRYLLSLDHVHSVEVKFMPGWISTVPHVQDHVDIIVQEVE